MMKGLVLALCILGTAARAPKWHELSSKYTYEQYLKDFHKTGSEEGRALFAQRIKDIVAHNSKPGVHTSV